MAIPGTPAQTAGRSRSTARRPGLDLAGERLTRARPARAAHARSRRLCRRASAAGRTVRVARRLAAAVQLRVTRSGLGNVQDLTEIDRRGRALHEEPREARRPGAQEIG